MTEMTVTPNVPKKRATKKAPDRRSPEGILAYIKKRLKDSPPAPNGAEPVSGGPRRSGIRRSTRLYFTDSPRFPDGINVGGSELHDRDEQGKYHMTGFRADVSTTELEILECYAFDRPYLTDEERRDRKREADIRRNEMKRYGRQVTTATPEEQVMAAVAQVSDPKMKAALLRAAAEEAEKSA